MQTPQWRTLSNNTLTRTIICENFVNAVHIINLIVPKAERAQHHPDIQLKNYKELTIALTTHDADHTVTQKDLDLAREIDTVLEKLNNTQAQESK